METVKSAFEPSVEVLVVWNQPEKRCDILITDKTKEDPSARKSVCFDLAGKPTAAGLLPVIYEVVRAMQSVVGVPEPAVPAVPAVPAGQPVVWDGDQRNAWLAPLKGLRLKPYTFHECLVAAASTRAHPERWGPLAQMLHMRAGRGDMEMEQALATVGLINWHGPAELQTLDADVERLMALGPHAGVLLPRLAPHEQRVVQEREELRGRLERLNTFMTGPVFKSLPQLDQDLLHRQNWLMIELAFVLAERIERFQPAGADSEGGEI